MRFHIFDMFYTDPSQVYEFLLSMGKSGLVAGVYLWINRLNGKMYVGSSINMYARMSWCGGTCVTTPYLAFITKKG